MSRFARRAMSVSWQQPSGLSDSTATQMTINLYTYLKTLKTTDKILAGQQVDYTTEGLLSEQNMEWLRQNTGKLPAIGGFDFMKYTPSRVEHGDSGVDTQRALDWWRTNTYSGTSYPALGGSNGGIVTFCWHWNAPNGTSANWWEWTNANATNFRPASAMADTSSGGGLELLYRDIDAIAVQLKILRDAGVVVLWRPIHEANNGYFWWGADGATAFKQLWQLLYTRLTIYHGLHNLIWTWSANWYPSNNFAAWYPGDNYVDIGGVDSYDSTAADHNPLSTLYNAMNSIGSKHLLAVSECGPIPDPALMHASGNNYSWLYFVTWSDSDGIHDMLGTKNTASYTNNVYNLTSVITRDELPNWRMGSF